MHSLRAIIVACALSATLSACGAETKDKHVGDGGVFSMDSGVCSMIEECGGDVVGTWELDSLCFDNIDALLPGALVAEMVGPGPIASMNNRALRSRVAAACAGTVKSAAVTASGTYVFHADAQVTIDVRYRIAFDTTWSDACLDATSTAPLLTRIAQCDDFERGLDRSPDLNPASCELGIGSCACKISTVEKRVMDMGAYRVLDGKLWLPDDWSSYCVRGNTLKMLRTSVGVRGTMLFHRQ